MTKPELQKTTVITFPGQKANYLNIVLKFGTKLHYLWKDLLIMSY